MERAAGSRLGEYEIVAPLGAGGMGEVYRCKDPRLKREVAIKLLSASALQDPERRKRFQYEAQAASALNHPNILVVFDIGTAEDTPYIVSELVEGASLRNSMQGRPLPIRKILDLAVQIADGLAAAHQAGIVHRDLKPENILVTSNDRIKILDFGLAKLHPTEPGEEAQTLSRALTQTGMIQGTVPYMSPEQASGKKLDFRSDQFSFGLILYEMASGKRAFARDTAAETLSAIISEEPVPLSTLNPKIPAPLRWLIDQCLNKEPRHRYDSTADLYRELRNLRDHLSETTSSEILPAASGIRDGRKKVWLAFAAMALIGATAGMLISPAFLTNKSINLSENRYTVLASASQREHFPAWSSDGEAISYLKAVDGIQQVFVRNLSSSVSAQLTTSSEDCSRAFWDPSGNRIFYLTESGLWFRNIAGGSAQRMFENVSGAAISPNGKSLALVRQIEKKRELWISSPPGTEPRKFELTPSVSITSIIQFSFDGSFIGAWVETSGGFEFWLIRYPAGEAKKIQIPKQLTDNSEFSFMPDGEHIVFGGNVWVGGHLLLLNIENDTSRLITAGYLGGEHAPAVSPDGRRIAFVSTQLNFDIVSIPVDGSPKQNLIATSEDEMSPAWTKSPNQLMHAAERNGIFGIWLTSIAEQWSRPLVTARDIDPHKKILFDNPSFSPDGQRIAFQVNTSSIWVSNVAGGKPVELVSAEYNADGPSWSPDGNWICFLIYISTGADQISVGKLKVGELRKPELLKENVRWHIPRWSPNGEWITCVTREGLLLISPDGKSSRVLSKGSWGPYSCWSPDSSTVYGWQFTERRHWVLSSVDVNTLKVQPINDLGPTETYWGLSLSPDNKAIASSVLKIQSDIWMVEGFEQPSGWFERLWRRNE